MLSKNSFVIYSYIVLIFVIYCRSEKVTFINVEHPHVEYYSKDYFRFVNLTTIRFGRANPVYYVGFNFENILPMDTSIHVSFYFFELLTNVYKRGFIELHYNWCTLLEKDVFFGAALRQGKLTKPCPHPPDVYNLYNMTINPAIIPRGFPITRGRIYCNLTHVKTKARIGDGHIDMKISQVDKKKVSFK